MSAFPSPHHLISQKTVNDHQQHNAFQMVLPPSFPLDSTTSSSSSSATHSNSKLSSSSSISTPYQIANPYSYPYSHPYPSPSLTSSASSPSSTAHSPSSIPSMSPHFYVAETPSPASLHSISPSPAYHHFNHNYGYPYQNNNLNNYRHNGDMSMNMSNNHYNSPAHQLSINAVVPTLSSSSSNNMNNISNVKPSNRSKGKQFNMNEEFKRITNQQNSEGKTNSNEANQCEAAETSVVRHSMATPPSQTSNSPSWESALSGTKRRSQPPTIKKKHHSAVFSFSLFKQRGNGKDKEKGKGKGKETSLTLSSSAASSYVMNPFSCPAIATPHSGNDRFPPSSSPKAPTDIVIASPLSLTSGSSESQTPNSHNNLVFNFQQMYLSQYHQVTHNQNPNENHYEQIPIINNVAPIPPMMSHITSTFHPSNSVHHNVAMATEVPQRAKTLVHPKDFQLMLYAIAQQLQLQQEKKEQQNRGMEMEMRMENGQGQGHEGIVRSVHHHSHMIPNEFSLPQSPFISPPIPAMINPIPNLSTVSVCDSPSPPSSPNHKQQIHDGDNDIDHDLGQQHQTSFPFSSSSSSDGRKSISSWSILDYSQSHHGSPNDSRENMTIKNDSRDDDESADKIKDEDLIPETEREKLSSTNNKENLKPKEEKHQPQLPHTRSNSVLQSMKADGLPSSVSTPYHQNQNNLSLPWRTGKVKRKLNLIDSMDNNNNNNIIQHNIHNENGNPTENAHSKQIKMFVTDEPKSSHPLPSSSPSPSLYLFNSSVAIDYETQILNKFINEAKEQLFIKSQKENPNVTVETKHDPSGVNQKKKKKKKKGVSVSEKMMEQEEKQKGEKGEGRDNKSKHKNSPSVLSSLTKRGKDKGKGKEKKKKFPSVSSSTSSTAVPSSNNHLLHNDHDMNMNMDMSMLMPMSMDLGRMDDENTINNTTNNNNNNNNNQNEIENNENGNDHHLADSFLNPMGNEEESNVHSLSVLLPNNSNDSDSSHPLSSFLSNLSPGCSDSLPYYFSPPTAIRRKLAFRSPTDSYHDLGMGMGMETEGEGEMGFGRAVASSLSSSCPSVLGHYHHHPMSSSLPLSMSLSPSPSSNTRRIGSHLTQLMSLSTPVQ